MSGVHFRRVKPPIFLFDKDFLDVIIVNNHCFIVRSLLTLKCSNDWPLNSIGF